MELRQIGVIGSPYKTKEDAPHQGRFSKDVCEIVIFDEFSEGLKDIESFTHLIVLYWLHEARRDTLLAKPPHDDRIRGVFATRSPNRPNPIGFAVVKLLERKGNVLRVTGLDAIDGTPLIDIKPYSSAIDCVEDAKDAPSEKNVKNTYRVP
ncbi:MAG: tRNA (N6-threonylcarbamoyladenosine(37)-N6)-methyltransferase TrmO [Archaeoglobales archaeon]|nr:tRNA (N6-threonylcarbamoyladenosine(37)-N6)-methyltransferase TrmO [Archaeoglobales archaeon]